MINDLLQRLLAAETDEERSWIATESLLESLPEDVESALWAVAIPHWFDAEILAALCPELADRADEIYRQLQDLSCVEVFPERGHNVHELTRNQLLDRLRQHNPERFRDLSGKAAEYFANVDNQEFKIEWIYHLMATREDRGVNELVNLVNDLPNNFRRAELERNIKKLEFTQKRLQQAEITKRIAMGLAFSVFTSVLIYSGITGDKVLTEKVIIGLISVVAGAGSILINQQKDKE